MPGRAISFTILESFLTRYDSLVTHTTHTNFTLATLDRPCFRARTRGSRNYAANVCGKESGERGGYVRNPGHRRCRNGEPRCAFPRATTIFDEGSSRPMKIGFSRVVLRAVPRDICTRERVLHFGYVTGKYFDFSRESRALVPAMENSTLPYRPIR